MSFAREKALDMKAGLSLKNFFKVTFIEEAINKIKCMSYVFAAEDILRIFCLLHAFGLEISQDFTALEQ